MSKAKDKKDGKKPTYRIAADSPWANAWKLALVVGGIGLAAWVFGAWTEPPDEDRAAFSWLFAYMTFLAIALGSLFFTLGQHLTGAGWGVSVRRTAEMLMIGLPVFALLFVPIALKTGDLYLWAHHGEHEEAGESHGGGNGAGEAEGGAHHGSLGDEAPFGFGAPARAQDPLETRDFHPDEWAHLPGRDGAEHAAAEHGAEHHDPNHTLHSETIEAKTGYLNQTFFVIRAVIYFLAWLALSLLFFRWSTRQDKEKGLKLTQRMESVAPPSTFVFAFSLTFAAFDWTMSMEPSWYSTIFGVQYFAVSCVSAFSVIILLTLGLRRAGVLGDAVNVEHYHDVAKLLHGFIIFWAYISLSQLLLIWYAGIPEEATYYHLRWWGGGGFLNLSIVLMIGHFLVPFFLLLSRNQKRKLPVLAFACAWIVVFRVVEMYWVVMPYAEQQGVVETSLRLHWLDVAAFLAVGGIYLGFVLFQMTRYPLVPIGDPRLNRSLTFLNA